MFSLRAIVLPFIMSSAWLGGAFEIACSCLEGQTISQELAQRSS